MAKSKLTGQWDNDIYGKSVLLLEKKRGKITVEEIGDFLRYGQSGMFQGNYVMLIRAGEATCGISGWDMEEQKGDVAELYRVDDSDECPVCGKMTPPFEYCQNCGEPWKKEE